jgi:sec-independent protein translocase protein TatC
MDTHGSRRSDPDASRMTLGEHLDELRACVVRSLIALAAAGLLCIWPARYLIDIIARPYVIAQKFHDAPPNFLLTSPTEGFLIYLKVVAVSALILAGPYVLYQLWSFVAAGLYPNEKQWAYRLIPVSVGLFFAGIVFMYLFVILMCLNFLIGFGKWLPMPSTDLFPWEQALMGHAAPGPPASQPASAPTLHIPVLNTPPDSPQAGQLWFDATLRELRLYDGQRQFALPMTPTKDASVVTTHFRLDEYISFFLTMTLAFGVAFQMPLVVYFLVRTGIVTVDTFGQYRKAVIFGIVVVAAVLAPPDLLSHLLLAGPMIVLFEIGLLVARRSAKRTPPERRPSAEGR